MTTARIRYVGHRLNLIHGHPAAVVGTDLDPATGRPRFLVRFDETPTPYDGTVVPLPVSDCQVIHGAVTLPDGSVRFDRTLPHTLHAATGAGLGACSRSCTIAYGNIAADDPRAGDPLAALFTLLDPDNDPNSGKIRADALRAIDTPLAAAIPSPTTDPSPQTPRPR